MPPPATVSSRTGYFLTIASSVVPDLKTMSISGGPGGKKEGFKVLYWTCQAVPAVTVERTTVVSFFIEVGTRTMAGSCSIKETDLEYHRETGTVSSVG